MSLICLPSSFLIHCRGGGGSTKICKVFVSAEEVNNATLAVMELQEGVRNCSAPLTDEDGISDKVLTAEKYAGRG